MPFTPTDYLPYDFANRRHIGPSPAEMVHMLETLGLSDLESLIDETLPKSIRQKNPLNFGKPKSERALLNHMRITASKNKVLQQKCTPRAELCVAGVMCPGHVVFVGSYARANARYLEVLW